MLIFKNIVCICFLTTMMELSSFDKYLLSDPLPIRLALMPSEGSFSTFGVFIFYRDVPGTCLFST